MLGVGEILTVRDVPELDGSVFVSCDEEVSAAACGIGLHIASVNGPLLQGEQVHHCALRECMCACACMFADLHASRVGDTVLERPRLFNQLPYVWSDV